MISRHIQEELYLLSNVKKAEQLQRFFKTGIGEYGEGDVFIGVTLPNIRKLVKPYTDLPFQEIDYLLKSEIHEVRICAVIILVNKFQKTKHETQKKEIIEFYLDHTERLNNWDLVDLSCYKILGAYLKDKADRSILYKLAESKHLWSERIAMVSTYAFIKEHQFEDAIKLAEKFIDHKHDLMHKAVGWMLKETGKRDKKILTDFLKNNYKIMSRTTLRYAIEKFPEEERQAFLKGNI